MKIQSILDYGNVNLAKLDSDNENVKIERLRKFLEELGDINFQDNMGISALHLFMMNGWWEGIQLVLNNPDAKLDLLTRKDQTALHWAMGDSLECVRLLCEDARMSLQMINKKDIDGCTALQLARQRKNLRSAADFISKTKLKLSREKKEISRKKPSPTNSSDSDETGGNNFDEETETETNASNQSGPSRGVEYFEETEQKPKRLKTEAKTEDAYFSLCEELVSMKRIIEDFTKKISEKETENQNILQEQIENMKVLKNQVQQEHKVALDRLRAEQEKEVENLERTLEKERQALQSETQESLKPLQEAHDKWQRQCENIKARLRTTLQGEPTDLPKCPSCDLPFDDKMIFSCLEGHTICSDCRPQCETCMECSEEQRGLGYPARNTFMEAQMRKLMAGR